LLGGIFPPSAKLINYYPQPSCDEYGTPPNLHRLARENISVMPILHEIHNNTHQTKKQRKIPANIRNSAL
jgi:hypothetical protein